MLSSKKNILQLTSLMLKKGVSEVVVCPGSRNAPLIHTFASVGMHCYEVTDERSAGFFALGLIEAKGRPVAVCCTSGSAVLNLAPAVAEAYYRPLPLLVITADRPAQWIGQMDGQTMPQLAAFGQTVRKVVNLPEEEGAEWHINRLINEVLIEMERSRGPVHVNVPLSEPLFDFSAEELSDERVINYHSGVKDASLPDESLALWRAARRPMIVIGQMLPEETRRIEKHLAKLAPHCVVLAEELSNLKEEYITCRYFDNVIANNGNNDNLLPDFIVTLGGHIVAKNLKQWLRGNSPQNHWSVSRTGEVADLFQCLTMVWECDAERALEVFAQNVPSDVDADFIGEWGAQSKNLPMTPVDWEIAVLEQTLKLVPASWNIHVANSSMVRDIQRLPSTGCTIYCNRGVNGIEGSVSAAVGLAAGSKRETLLLVGDLSFFYDRNGLWNNYVKGGELPDGGHLHLSVLLLNNGGGRIFRNIPGMERTPYRDTMVSGKHSTSAEGVAVESGCDNRFVDADDISDEHIKWLMSEWAEEDKCVRILEIRKR